MSKLSEINEMLFEQLKKVKESKNGELQDEVKRAMAMSSITKEIIRSQRLTFDALKFITPDKIKENISEFGVENNKNLPHREQKELSLDNTEEENSLSIDDEIRNEFEEFSIIHDSVKNKVSYAFEDFGTDNDKRAFSLVMKGEMKLWDMRIGEDKIFEIIKCLINGENPYALCDEYDISEKTIVKIIRNFGETVQKSSLDNPLPLDKIAPYGLRKKTIGKVWSNEILTDEQRKNLVFMFRDYLSSGIQKLNDTSTLK